MNHFPDTRRVRDTRKAALGSCFSGKNRAQRTRLSRGFHAMQDRRSGSGGYRF